MAEPSNFVYLAISEDKYELPVAVFENIKQIAKYAGVTYNHACSMVARGTVNKKNKCRYVKVEIKGKTNEQ